MTTEDKILLRMDTMKWHVCKMVGHDYSSKGKNPVTIQKENRNYVYKSCCRCGNHILDYKYRWT